MRSEDVHADVSTTLVARGERVLSGRDLDDALLDGLDANRLARRKEGPVGAGRNHGRRFVAHALILALAACSTDWNVPSAPGAALGEQYCEAYGIDCGHVYEFEAPADNPLGHVELCVLDEDIPAAEAQYGAARLTSRFEGENLCYWHCDGGKGCNAYNSCYCPEGL